jgi:cytochrome c-type biogenesis protein CcmH/NrfG
MSNTGLFGFESSQPVVIKKGYNKKATDNILQKHRQNAEVYRERIRELDEELDVVATQRDAMKNLFYEYLDKFGVEYDEEEIREDFERHVAELS